MISLKDYAKNHNVGYEAIRVQVNKNKEQLEGHVHVQNKIRYLDEEGERILDEIRGGNSIVVFNVSKDEEIERLKNENEALKNKLIESQDHLVKAKDLYILLQDKYTALLEAPKDNEGVQEATGSDEEVQVNNVSPDKETAFTASSMTFGQRLKFVFGKDPVNKSDNEGGNV